MKTDNITNFKYEHTVYKMMHSNQHVFEFYSNKNECKSDKSMLGTLVCHKSEYPLRPNYDESVLAIDFLEVTDKNKGYGTKILKFAENFSKQTGCNGFMSLKSDTSYTPQKIPHIFYRKFGFSTFDKAADKKLDKFIKQGTDATSKDFPSILMHYPPQTVKQTLLNKFVTYIGQLLKK